MISPGKKWPPPPEKPPPEDPDEEPGATDEDEMAESSELDSALEKCIQRTTGKLSWPKFYGERKYTEVPFNITKPRK